MQSSDAVLITFTDSNPPRVTSHQNWVEVYDLIGRLNSNHPDPYFIQTDGKTVVLMHDGEGNVEATLKTTENAFVLYDLSGGVWIELAENSHDGQDAVAS
jgi:hypothetical protein